MIPIPFPLPGKVAMGSSIMLGVEAVAGEERHVVGSRIEGELHAC
jgi:hypothetical protein